MQKFTQKYTIVCFLEDKAVNYEYSSSQWSLHMTLADTFSIEWNITEFMKELVGLSDKLKPVSLKTSHYEYFGPEKQTQVVIYDTSKEITALHYEIIHLLKSAGVKFNDPQYTGAGFRAHSTVQARARVKIGEVVHIKNIALVDMLPDEDANQRRILKLIKL